MKLLSNLAALLVIACLGLAVCGCGAPKSPPGEKVIAKINDYDMTAEDFRDSARAVGGTKEEALEELITRNILIQEAQNENFDKDKVFMKEIEKYWEQALLKLLIKKKMVEFSADFKGDEKKVEDAVERWIKNLRAGAKVKIYKENLNEVNVP